MPYGNSLVLLAPAMGGKELTTPGLVRHAYDAHARRARDPETHSDLQSLRGVEEGGRAIIISPSARYPWPARYVCLMRSQGRAYGGAIKDEGVGVGSIQGR